MTKMKYPFLWIALDGLTKRERETLIVADSLAEMEEFYPNCFGFKINLDYISKNGLSDVVLTIASHGSGLPIFTDFKMWNGSRTMADLVDELVQLEVDFVNVYAEADKEIEKAVRRTEGTKTKILGLTVLSHYDDGDCLKKYRRTLKESVEFFGKMALDNGCHGIILPGTCLNTVQGWNTIKLATGGRPIWYKYKDNRHKQEMTPFEMVICGADMLVCGSPIVKSEDPVSAFHRIMTEITPLKY